MLHLYQYLLNQTKLCWAFWLTNHNQEEGKICSWKQLPFDTISATPFWSISDKMVHNGPIWSKMVQNGPGCSKWSNMVQHGPIWSNMVQHGPIWSKVIQKNRPNGSVTTRSPGLDLALCWMYGWFVLNGGIVIWICYQKNYLI